ncbi:antibiotic transporter [Microbispora rosea subsp. aerata]|nr:penicillin acylase family protein [Microbispora rosea]GGO22327.1 antibiotic transporter [Microbispora rosea subsp. aerata]GIH57464.1 antibiotic transporter [Microbispora rosea subsp. aerata]GLJ86414.1 antibiotic transporter [Microbispora rosea subsp. aerata]
MSVRVYRDDWGIPHLRADDPYELAFAQGRVTALDRAWQIEVERRRATGTSAAVLGPDAVPWDRFARQVRLADTAQRCLHALDDDTARWVSAYADGVNAGLPEGARRAPQFAATGLPAARPEATEPESTHSDHAVPEPKTPGLRTARPETIKPEPTRSEAADHAVPDPKTPRPRTARPEASGRSAAGAGIADPAGPGAAGVAVGRWEPWTPLAIWLSHHILFAYFPAKLWREAVAERLGPDAVALFATDGPGTSGSNGWLVPPDRTTTGAALIAGDPHRFIEDPGFYQQIRLACPEFDVVGLAVPGVPGIAHFGHAGSVAWAITNAMSDYHDLYRERLRRVDGRVEALGPDGWRPCDVRVEVVEVAGDRPVEVEVIETDRGPIVMPGVPGQGGSGPTGPGHGETAAEGPDHAHPREDGVSDGARNHAQEAVRDHAQDTVRDHEREAVRDHARDTVGGTVRDHAWEAAREDTWEALSLRYPPRVRRDLGFAALPALLRARTVADVDRALDHWAEPVNVVLAADVDGGLLHRVAGVVPVRHPDNGLRTVPAWEPEHEWSGNYAPLPRRAVSGITVMANERALSAPLGVEFAPPYRAARIRSLLDGSPRWSAADMATVHTDTLLPSAGPLLDLLAGLDGLGHEAVRLRDRLVGWDRRMDAGSTDAAAYAEVRAEVVRRLAAHPALATLAGLAAEAPEIFRPYLALAPRVAYALESLLTTDRLPGLDRAALEDLARAALEDVAARGEATGVRWGDLHRLDPWRAVPFPAPSVDERPDVDTADARPAGDHDCVLSTSSVPGVTHHFARGPAARYVWDLSRRDGSLWIVPFGASGVPGDPHWHDQHPLWLRGELAPVVTDWDKLTEEQHDH